MRCSLECHAGCACRPNQPILTLVKRDEPVTMEAMMEALSEATPREQYIEYVRKELYSGDE